MLDSSDMRGLRENFLSLYRIMIRTPTSKPIQLVKDQLGDYTGTDPGVAPKSILEMTNLSRALWWDSNYT